VADLQGETSNDRGEGAVEIDPVVAALEAAVRNDPDSVELRAHLLAVYRERDRVDAARRELGEILVRHPDHHLVPELLRAAHLVAGPSPSSTPRSGTSTDTSWEGTLPSDGGSEWWAGGPPLPPIPPPPPVPFDGISPASTVNDPGTPFGSGNDPTEWESPDVSLDDVAGMEDVKERLELVVFGPARRPDLAAAFGRAGRGGLLLWGPPGCGKTYLAKAVAGHLGVTFGAVGIEAVLDRWLGASERNLAAVFAAAREDPPCVLFLDEVDAIGQRRSRLASEHLRTVMSQLLVELDGVDRDNRGLFVIAASNLPWDVDPALRRPGRLDRSVFVPPPDHEARARILVDRLATLPLAEVDIPAVVRRTHGFSGADVAHLADTAAELALAESIAGDDVVPISQRHLEQARAQVEPSIADWVATARNAATWSDDEALFGPFLAWLEDWERGR
jgi:AAA+ superfamily predicted ATPase